MSRTTNRPGRKRITSLSPGEKARMGAWADEWIARGLSTAPADWEEWERGAKDCYRFAGIEWPGVVVRVGDPLTLALAAPAASEILRHGGEHGAVDATVRDAVAGAMYGAVDVAVAGAVDDAVAGAVRDAVAGAVRDAVAGAVAGAVRDAVAGAVEGAVRDAVYGAVKTAWHNYLGGTYWLSWQAYTSFLRDVMRLDLPGDLWERDRAYARAQQSAGWWWPHRQFVMVCDRPAEIHRERVGPTGLGSHRLHRADGPAVRYRSGWSIYALHGVRMEPWMVETPEANLDPAKVLTVENAEQRRELIRRVGVERMLSALPHSVIDTQGDYALLDVRLSEEIPHARYLKMRNPSIGVWHVEGVHPGCATVAQAINWRNSGDPAVEWVPDAIS